MPENSQPRAVFLLGFMGAGKTSVGKALARRLGWRFVDLDQQIEMRAGQPIGEIFAAYGEHAFRTMETVALRQLLAELSHGSPAVVALGEALLSANKMPHCSLLAARRRSSWMLLLRSCANAVARPLWRAHFFGKKNRRGFSTNHAVRII